jgi:hypothetical protein
LLALFGWILTMDERPDKKLKQEEASMPEHNENAKKARVESNDVRHNTVRSVLSLIGAAAYHTEFKE